MKRRVSASLKPAFISAACTDLYSSCVSVKGNHSPRVLCLINHLITSVLLRESNPVFSSRVFLNTSKARASSFSNFTSILFRVLLGSAWVIFLSPWNLRWDETVLKHDVT